MCFICSESKKNNWVYLKSIQNFLRSIGDKKYESKYIETILSDLERKNYIKRHGCGTCENKIKMKCENCRYDFFRNRMQANKQKYIPKSIITMTKLGKIYTKKLIKSILNCAQFVNENFKNQSKK